MYFPMFGCLILHQRNTERSGTEMEERSRECIFQCSVALFYISVTRSGAERRWKKGPGNVFGSTSPNIGRKVVFRDKKWNGTEWNGMKWNEMEKNGSEQTHTEQAFLAKKPSFLPFGSVAFVHNNFFAKTSTLF